MLSQFRGLVLSETAWGEHDKLLTVLTAEVGKIPVLLKGGSSLKNHSGGACLPICYSEFVTADRGGRPWVREASEIESFSHLRMILEDSALAMYMCDVANEVCVENGDEAEMLQLMLNTLYALDRGLKERKTIRAAFEMRAAAVCGFSPDLVGCSECGCGEAETMYLDVMDGVLQCAKCHKKHNESEIREGHTALLLTLDKTLLNAMRHVCYAGAKKYLSFELPEDAGALFSLYCEKYLLNHLGRGFASLDFYKSLDMLP